jgi:hypothetical protein
MNKLSDADVDDLVTDLVIEIAARLIEMRTLFFDSEAVLTLIVRNPSSENAGCIFTTDTYDTLIDALQTMKRLDEEEKATIQ